MLVWISDLGMKKGFRKSPETLSVELRGLPQSVAIPPFCRCVGLPGTSLGTLRGFFSRFFSLKETKMTITTYSHGNLLLW